MEVLKARLIQDLKRAGLSDSTRSIYLRAVLQFARSIKRSPADVGQVEVREWVEQLSAGKLSA